MKPNPSVLVVDDDPEVRALVELYLNRHGYRTSTAETGRHALDFLKRESPDLLILDVVLPDVNGVELCRAIRRYSDVPVLFLSWKGTPDDIIAGLDKGGDDYVTKPFDPMVLVARVKARLRRTKVEREETPRPQTLCFGNVEIDFRSYNVRVDGRPVELFTKERQLLFFLARHPDQVFSPTQLHHHVWGWDAPSDERTVPVHISNLRKKSNRIPAAPSTSGPCEDLDIDFLHGKTMARAGARTLPRN